MSGNSNPVLVRKVHRGLLESELSELSLTNFRCGPCFAIVESVDRITCSIFQKFVWNGKTRRLPVFAQGASRHRSIPLDTSS
jgi:hypothetical protein